MRGRNEGATAGGDRDEGVAAGRGRDEQAAAGQDRDEDATTGQGPNEEAAAGRGQDEKTTTGQDQDEKATTGQGQDDASQRVAAWLRGGLAVLTCAHLGVGLWQLFAPRSFYGVLWVSTLPPYNEHLMRDLGAMILAVGVVVAAAARSMEPRLVSAALTAELTFAVPHLLFHSTHSGQLAAWETAALLGLLGATMLFPAWLLWLSARVRTARPAPRP